MPEKYYAKIDNPLPLVQRLDRAEQFFAATNADIRHGGSRAFYSPGSDHVQMPPFESFETRESYYSTLAHECTHNAAFRIMPRRSPVLLNSLRIDADVSALSERLQEGE